MLRTLILIIIAILIFAPILSGVMKILGIANKQSATSFSELKEKINSITGESEDSGTEIHTQKLAEKSGVFLFAKDVKRTTLVSISKKKSEFTLPVVTSIAKPDNDECKSSACLCLCASGLEYEVYKYNYLDKGITQVQALEPPLNYDISKHIRQGDRWQLFELACPKWSCTSIKGSPKNPLSIVPKTSINDSEFIDRDKYIVLEEYFLDGFMAFYIPGIAKDVYTAPPVRQKPYPYNKPQEQVIVFERFKDKFTACYHAPCISEEDKKRIQYGKDYESIKSFENLQKAFNDCFKDSVKLQEVEVKLKNQIFMYLTINSDGTPKKLFLQDESDPDNPKEAATFESKICHGAKQLQKVQNQKFSIKYETNECCLNTT